MPVQFRMVLNKRDGGYENGEEGDFDSFSLFHDRSVIMTRDENLALIILE
jgi:hypothetical protein